MGKKPFDEFRGDIPNAEISTCVLRGARCGVKRSNELSPQPRS